MKQKIQQIFDLADVKINGNRPWDIQVENEKLYSRILSGGSLALGESYMDGWWDCKKLDQFFDKILSADLDKKVRDYSALVFTFLKAKLTNLQSVKRAFRIGEHHYDIGNDLYEIMLDKNMAYTCGYWKDAKTLDEAQDAKLDLICKKLKLKSGMKVLDVGCGWGGFVRFAAKKYGVTCVGITVSREQAKLAKKRCKGLPVEIRLQDYRKVDEKFDAIVSVGMFEHVGCKNYKTFMQVVEKNLKPGGLQMLHTIAGNKSVRATDPWISKYIFPNSMLPSAKQISSAIEGLFVLEDWHSFGVDYDKTLMIWYNNFVDGWDQIKDKYGERFFRMWSYYLLSCSGSFRARKNQLWQIVLSKGGVRGGYKSIR
ncbi:cyclopropane fatty acyl phospholipid synthase [Candidatus Kuenenbacteria bacterium]|nr:cyclopropane fatty acyl phospholipid synthase [Candidatus Kuenenbacteria bacterium]